MLLSADRMLHADGRLDPGWVRTDGERIVATGTGDADGPVDLSVRVLSPGFVDLHCHGGAGFSYDRGALEEVRAAVAAHRREGTLSTLLSLVSADIDTLAEQVARLTELYAAGDVAGIHLEGPWLSPSFGGAHDPAALRAPTAKDIDRLLSAGRIGGDTTGAVRMVTLAPELPGGLDAIRQLSDAGVIVAIGHTDADEADVARAVDAGASVATHLFNAMRPLHHRAPGPVPTLLADDRVVVELIADGRHLHPDVLAMAARSARGGFALVTDAMAAAMAQDGDYLLGEIAVEVRDGTARVASTGSIAGSTLTMSGAVRTTVRAGIPLADALSAASAVPAGALGRRDIGALEAGRRADLVCLDDDLTVTAVLGSGEWVVAPGAEPPEAPRRSTP